MCIWPMQCQFSCSIKCETILLPFLCSVASNGTCGFSMFSSSEKECLQVQCQTALSMKWTKITEITSNTLFFLMCGHRSFAEQKETLSGFHSLKLAILSQMRWVEISSSLINRSTFEENQGKSHSSVQK